MANFPQYNLDGYQYSIHVVRGRRLYGMSGKVIYEGSMIANGNERVITVEMNQTITEREAEFYLAVNNHENIIKTLGYIHNDKNLTIFIQEYAQFNDLGSVLLDNQFNLSPMVLMEMFIQIADAMSYVARKRIIHGDLGCRNVLVFQVDPNDPKNNRVKLTDFGLARWMDRRLINDDENVIPIRFCAPEILRNMRPESYSEKSDVYSFAIFIWEALSNGEFPFASIAEDEDVKKMKLANTQLKLKQPPTCTDQLWNLMEECWHDDPKRRPTFERIKNKLSNTEIPNDTNLRNSISPRESPINYKYELDVDVRMRKSLGGSFSHIYEAEWIKGGNGRRIVLIRLNQEPSECETEIYNDFNRHDHIIDTFGFVKSLYDYTLLLQERSPFNNLQSLLETGEFQPSSEVLKTIFLQIIEAMIYIVGQGIIHNDLRCSNMLVFSMHPSDSQKNVVKLTNFSSARRKDLPFVDDRRLPIQVPYCAPEILRSAGRSNYSELSEIYSMGVLMWQACSKGKQPFKWIGNDAEVRQRKLNGEKLPKPCYYHRKFWLIMMECWYNQPECRYDNFNEMKDRLLTIDFDPVEPYAYRLNRDVRQRRCLSDVNGKFYEAEWIPKKDPPIVLLVLNARAHYETSLYLQLKDHRNIIDTFGLVENDQQSIMLVQKRAAHGNLQILLQHENFRPSIPVFVNIFVQITGAMTYIKEQGIVHANLRCSNILVFEMNEVELDRNRVKLTNFNISGPIDQPITLDTWPENYFRYCARENLFNENQLIYLEQSDVYSMGILIWQAFSKGKLPYGHGLTDEDIRQRRREGEQLLKPKQCPPSIWSIIEDYCWCQESSIRATFEELKSYLMNIDLTAFNTERCNQCNKDIPKNEMINHKKYCSEAVRDNVAHFTRCHYCSERCLGSELEEHQEKCSLRSPSKPILTKKCDFCHKECRQDEVLQHEGSCGLRTKPSLSHERFHYVRCKYCKEEYLDNEITNHQRTCRRPPTPPVEQVECTYCKKLQPLSSINKHENSCPFKPSRVYVPKPTKQCQYCPHRCASNEIANHERDCPSRSRIPDQPVRTRPCIHCHEQHPINSISLHENSCRLKQRSCMDYISSWFCCCCD